MRDTLTIRNDEGRPFTVRVVEKGDTFGLDHCLTHPEDEPLIEFYDATQAGDDRFDSVLGLGQFVSRYYLSTLLEREPHGRGLCLYGGEPAWNIDAPAMRRVDAFCQRIAKRPASTTE